jgi:hypothetical protein
MNKIAEQMDKHFGFLINDFKFIKKEESFEKTKLVSITFENPIMGIFLEVYFTEIYMHVYKCTYPEEKINIYNLLNFLNRDSKKCIKSKYFKNEKNKTKRIYLQIEWLSNLLKNNFDLIREFISDEHYYRHLSEITKYVLHQNPGLFKNVRNS